MYLEGKSYYQISCILDEEKVLYPEHNKWTEAAVRTIINNRIYRCQNHGIFAKNPIICIGNEIINYAHGYEESASSVIDAV